MCLEALLAKKRLHHTWFRPPPFFIITHTAPPTSQGLRGGGAPGGECLRQGRALRLQWDHVGRPRPCPRRPPQGTLSAPGTQVGCGVDVRLTLISQSTHHHACANEIKPPEGRPRLPLGRLRGRRRRRRTRPGLFDAAADVSGADRHVCVCALKAEGGMRLAAFIRPFTHRLDVAAFIHPPPTKPSQHENWPGLIGLVVRITSTTGWLAPPLNDLLPGQVYVQVVMLHLSWLDNMQRKRIKQSMLAPLQPPNKTKLKTQNLPSLVVGHVLCPTLGSTVIDLCACPGGKATHLAALVGSEGLVVACDRTYVLCLLTYVDVLQY